MTTYPIIFQSPDGRRITCYDGEHAAAVHILTDPLIWRKAGANVRADGDIDWTALERAAGPWSSGERLLTQAAMDLYCGLTSGSTAGLKRLCHVLDTPHLARVLQAVCLLRPDVTHFATRAGGHPSGPGSRTEEA